jgi:PAS domain S-box-containing protein
LSSEPDGDYSATFISENIKDLLGYEAREFLENSTFWIDRLHPDDVEPVLNKLSNPSVNDFHYYEYRFLRSDGVYRWMLNQIRLIRDNTGRPTEILGYWIDITDRKQAEAELEKLSNRLALSLKSGAIGCWELDLAENVVLWDERMYELYGMTKTDNDLLGRDVRGNCCHPDDRLSTETLIHQAILGQAEYDTEFRIVHPDGSIHFIKAYGVLVRDHRGEAQSMIGINFDITDRKQSELALQQAKEAAESANQAKSIFLSNMSHELRTPLNSILGFTQLMLNENALSPSSQERLQIVTRSGEYLLDLINDILDLSKIESGRMTLNNSEFDLTILLTSIQEMLQVKVQPKNVHLIFEQDPNLPRYIYTDEQKLYQVLVNLLGNAIKFTNQGSVILRVRVESREETSCNLYFEIKDTGVGISPDEIDNLFKVFVQAQAGNNLNQGTGLGLAISQKIMQLMGSQIQVQSTLNQGSTFSFKIEVQLPQVAVFTSELVNQRVIGLAINQPPYRILVVEDLSENRLLLVGILSAIGFEVREATQGIEAIALWESWSPHLIMMDLKMPLMDGYTATKRIRENSKSQETIIIALTASVFEEDREKVVNVGCNDFIRKPFQQKELFEKIAQHLGVQYIYKTIEESPQKSSVELLSVEALSEMSPQWLEDMYQAAYYLDADVMNELIAKIPKSKASLSKALTDSINNFSYERILELIRSLEYV